jgi:hypothetical protein
VWCANLAVILVSRAVILELLLLVGLGIVKLCTHSTLSVGHVCHGTMRDTQTGYCVSDVTYCSSARGCSMLCVCVRLTNPAIM